MALTAFPDTELKKKTAMGAMAKRVGGYQPGGATGHLPTPGLTPVPGGGPSMDRAKGFLPPPTPGLTPVTPGGGPSVEHATGYLPTPGAGQLRPVEKTPPTGFDVPGTSGGGYSGGGAAGQLRPAEAPFGGAKTYQEYQNWVRQSGIRGPVATLTEQQWSQQAGGQLRPVEPMVGPRREDPAAPYGPGGIKPQPVPSVGPIPPGGRVLPGGPGVPTPLPKTPAPGGERIPTPTGPGTEGGMGTPTGKPQLLRAEGSPEVYIIENGVKRHIANADVFNAAGFGWGDVQDVPAAEVEKYQTGSQYTGAGQPAAPAPPPLPAAGLGKVTEDMARDYAAKRVAQNPTGPSYQEHYNWAMDPYNYPGQLEQHLALGKAEISAAEQAKITESQQQLLEQVGAGREEFQTEQRESEADFLKRYTEALGGQESMEAMYQRMSGELGLPQLREERQALSRQAVGLEETLAGMPKQVAGETRGYDVSARQQARLEQARADPFREQLIQMGRRAGLVGEELTGAEAQLGTRMGLTQAQQEKMLKPYAMEKDILSERTARETTGYNMDKQNELDVLLNRIEAGEALSAEERQKAHELSVLEMQFMQEQKKLEQQAGIAKEEAETGFGYDLKLLQETSRLAEQAAGPEQQRKIDLLREAARIAAEVAPNDQRRQIELLQEQSRLAGLDTQVITAGGSMLLIDMQTGIIVANLGAAPVAGGGEGGGVTLNLGGFEGLGGEPTETKPTAPPTDQNATLEDIFGKRSIGASRSW